MLHLIEGCRSDICQQQPRSRDELLDYTYCVACCVGLTSARIMGAGEASLSVRHCPGACPFKW